MPKGQFEILGSELFGEFSRYKLEKCRDRYGVIVYFVSDGERIDPITGLPEVIRQSGDRKVAMEGLE